MIFGFIHLLLLHNPPLSTDENVALIFSAVNGSAIGVGDGNNDLLAVTLSVTDGTLLLASSAGLSGLDAAELSGNVAVVDFSGSVADVNAALDGLVYDYTGVDLVAGASVVDNLTVVVDDLRGGTDIDVVSITVNGVLPIAVDLDGDGVEFSSVDSGLVLYDVDGDGVVESLRGWVDADDGWLVVDSDGDGVISLREELVLADWAGGEDLNGDGVVTDLDGLVAFDSNGDGQFDGQDDRFGDFYIWQDLNQDGVSDAGELRVLGAWGITAVDLVSDGQQVVVADGSGEVFGFGAVHFEDGRVHQFADSAVVYEEWDGLSVVVADVD